MRRRSTGTAPRPAAHGGSHRPRQVSPGYDGRHLTSPTSSQRSCLLPDDGDGAIRRGSCGAARMACS